MKYTLTRALTLVLFALTCALFALVVVPSAARAQSYGYYDPYGYGYGYGSFGDFRSYYQPSYYQPVSYNIQPSVYVPQTSYSSSFYYPYYPSYYPTTYYPSYYPSYSYGYGGSYPYDYSIPTGDTDALGNQLCYWEDYGRSPCDFNPHQWVYDPYTGTWY